VEGAGAAITLDQRKYLVLVVPAAAFRRTSSRRPLQEARYPSGDDMYKQNFSVTAAALALSALALAGCSKSPEADTQASNTGSEAVVVGQPNTTTEQLKDEARQLGADAKQAASDVKNEVKEAGEQASKDLKQAGNAASDKVGDAVITTSVNAELAKDPSLSATKIDVDTVAGRVALRGTAPSLSARDRATQLASAVKGVVSVDNQLTVEPAKM